MTRSPREPGTQRKQRAPATNPQAREKQLVAYAYDLAEEQMLKGTASSQVISHFLRLGSSLAELEKEKLRQENELLRAKTESLKTAERTEELYKKAMDAFRSYQPSSGGTEEDA